MMPLPRFTNPTEAINFISDRTQSGAHLTESELKSIITQLKNDYMAANAGDPKWKAAVLYSGASGSGVPELMASRSVAEGLTKSSGGILLTVEQTVAGQVLESKSFSDALKNASGEAQANKVLYGIVDSSGNRIQTGLWDDLSLSMTSHIKVPVSTVTPFATNGGTYSATELRALLNNPNVPTIDGIPRVNLLSEYNALGANDAALAKVRGYISDVSYAHLHQLNYGTDGSGSLAVGADKAFFSGAAGMGDMHLPFGVSSSGAVSSYFGNLDSARLSSFTDTAKFLAKYNVIDKIGTAGDLFMFSVAATTAIQLYNAGDTQGAYKTMIDWAVDFTGGVAGGIAGGQLAAGLLAIAPLVGLTPPGMVISSIIIAAGIIGGSLAGSWGAEELNQLIADAADLFGRAFTSPIVLDLNNNGLELSAVADGVYFDIDGDGFAEKTGWVKPSDAILTRDMNGNNIIDSQKEMFGTDAASTAAAKLAALDTNHGMIPAWQVAMMNIHLPAIRLSVNEG